MNAHKMIALAAVAASAAIPLAANAASVTIDSVTQRWPWNNKVDITYTVTDAQVRSSGLYNALRFSLTAGGKTYEIPGYSIGASAESGTAGTKQHTATWIAPEGIKATDCSITATLFTTNVPSGNDYMIIDLTNGEVYYEGLFADPEDSNNRYNNPEDNTYKTTKMVLRKVPKWADRDELPNAASFASLTGYPTGDNDDYSDSSLTPNTRKYWQTKKDFYVGIFLVTGSQYDRVVGATQSSSITPAYGKAYNAGVRGVDVSTSPVPETGDSFFSRLGRLTKAKSRFDGFDLPTDAMFEIAERAGTTTKFFWDSDDATDMATCSEYVAASTGKNVGSKKPNHWGFYDMLGNGYDKVRDRYTWSGRKINDMPSADPFTPFNGSGGVVWRGNGNSSGTTFGGHSSKREAGYGVTDTSHGPHGFRAAFVVQ